MQIWHVLTFLVSKLKHWSLLKWAKICIVKGTVYLYLLRSYIETKEEGKTSDKNLGNTDKRFPDLTDSLSYHAQSLLWYS